MDNKYGLGSTKVATTHHETHHKTTPVGHAAECKFCGSSYLEVSLTMHDHRCRDCGEWQNDIPAGYSTGRHSDY